jgi:hypothetical protein
VRTECCGETGVAAQGSDGGGELRLPAAEQIRADGVYTIDLSNASTCTSAVLITDAKPSTVKTRSAAQQKRQAELRHFPRIRWSRWQGTLPFLIYEAAYIRTWGGQRRVRYTGASLFSLVAFMPG